MPRILAAFVIVIDLIAADGKGQPDVAYAQVNSFQNFAAANLDPM